MKDFSLKWLGDLIERLTAIVWEPAEAKAGLALILLACGLLRVKPEGLYAWVGIIAGIVGAILVIAPQAAKYRRPPSFLIAVRHMSFDGNARPLERKDLPRAWRSCTIVPLDLDQASVFKNGKLEDPDAALTQQRDFKAHVASLVRAHPGAVVAYCGKAHIPLTFAAAQLAFSEIPMMFCELDRSTGAWRVLDNRAEGEDLGLKVKGTTVSSARGGDAVIKVEISYPIRKEDIAAVVPSPSAQISIAIANPRIDCITTEHQVTEIATAFRKALDDLKDARQINVFLAAPMSVVVGLGRLMRPSIHGRVVVHNFTSNTTPRYAWGINVYGKKGPEVITNRALAKGA